MKNMIKKFIKKLGDKNNEIFPQNGKLDCCNLNRENNKDKIQKPKK